MEARAITRQDDVLRGAAVTDRGGGFVGGGAPHERSEHVLPAEADGLASAPGTCTGACGAREETESVMRRLPIGETDGARSPQNVEAPH